MAASRYVHTNVNQLLKYLLFFFNFIFWLIGCILIAVGGWGFIEKNRFAFSGPEKHDFTIYDIIFDLTIIMIVVGGVVFTLAFAGCVGALRENICLLKFFSYALGILFVLQVVLAILAFVFSAAVKTKITEMLEMEGIIRYQGNDPDLTNFIDWFQKTFQCCGVGQDGFKDWNNNMYFRCNETNPSHWRCSVPFSCCINPTDIQVNRSVTSSAETLICV
ncbi:hypothetical protein LSH36_198g02000 [Paralvinella palmiformis]|uniref:Tetraspanin n=1 Tax=Paralvinella palmiformis TaxID=53620 RepID=A0AAD9JQ08_9ANNE|nr:hypothetical protein LSH36_198g02000 [Paralvinella palmiformis]